MIYIKLLKKTTRIYKSSPEGADGADNGGSGAKRGHKRGGDGNDALNYRKNLFDGGNNLLLEEVLLLGGINGGTEVHFIYKRARRGSKGVMPYADIIIWGTCVPPQTPPPPIQQLVSMG